MNNDTLSNLTPSSVQSFQGRLVQENAPAGAPPRSGILSNHTVAQVSNPLLRTLSSVASSSSVNSFFSYLGSRVTSSVGTLEGLSSNAAHHMASGIEYLASSARLPESTFVAPLLETAESYVRSAIINHVIPGAQQIGDGIGHLSQLTSSLLPPQERVPQPLEIPLEVENQDDYVLISRPAGGEQHAYTAPTAAPRRQIVLTPEELNGLLDHARNVSAAASDAEHQDHLIDATSDAEDQQNLQEISNRLNTFGLKIDGAAAEMDRATVSELGKITEAFKHPESL